MTELLGTIQDTILAAAGAPWVLLALFALCAVDGFFPPVPSESVVTALAVAGASTGRPNLLLVFAVAAAGAWVGDQVAYLIGRRIPLERIPALRTDRGQQALGWARHALERRGAAFILAARYIPVGRVAVNMSAGALGYPRQRFMALSGLAAVLWAGTHVLLGMLAEAWLGQEPLLAMAVGIAVGILSGVVLDRVLSRRLGDDAPTGAAGDAAGPARPAQGDRIDG